MDAHFIFRLFVVVCVIYLIAEFFHYINDEPEDNSRSARDIHIDTTKEDKEHN